MADRTDAQKRFRTTCDRCQASKVKCSREKPSCWRCSQSGQQCLYGPLRRNGRPPKRPSTSGQSVHHQPEVEGQDQSNILEHQDDQALDDTQSGQPQLRERVWSAQYMPEELSGTHSASETWQTNCLNPQTGTTQSLNVMEDFESLLFPMLNGSLGGVSSTMIMEGTTSSSLDMLPDSSIASLATGFDWNWDSAQQISLDGSHSTTTSIPFLDNESLVNTSTEDNLTQPESSLSFMQLENQQRMTMDHNSSLPDNRQQMTSSRMVLPEDTTRNKVQRSRLTNSSSECKTQCYQSLSGILAKVTECDIEHDEVSLETLLGLDREMQDLTTKALACQRCMEKSSSQTLIKIIIMGLDNLLSLFEQLQRPPPAAAWDGQPRPASLSKPPSSLSVGQWRDIPPSPLSLWTQSSLRLGGFIVDGSIKENFLRKVVLASVEALGLTLQNLERQIDSVMKGVNRKAARDMLVGIHRRAFFLRGKLVLASETSSTS